MNIAELGFKVNVAPLKDADKALDKLGDTAEAVDKSVVKVTDALDGLGKEAGTVAPELDKVDSGAKGAGSALGELGKKTKTAADSFDELLVGLRQQQQAMREQIVRTQGGAAALAEYRAAQIGMGNATDAQRAELAQLSKSLRTLEGDLDAAKSATRGAGVEVANAAENMTLMQQAGSGVTAMLGQLAAAAAAAFGIGQIIQAVDAYTRMTGQLTLATGSAAELAAAQERLFQIAQATRAPLEAVVSLYSRLSGALRETGVGSDQLAQITTTVSQAMAISGASAAAAEGAIIQLGQAFASGALRGDEFNSINEAAPRLMQALAGSLGVGTGALRAMAEQGQLTSEALSKALTGDQAAKIAAEFSKLPPTIAGATTVMTNAITKFIGELDKGTGASAAIAQAIISAANSIGPMSKTILDAATMIGDGFQAALIGLAAFVGARGIGALMVAGPGVIASLQTMVVVLRALAVSAAPAGVAMTGFATSMGMARVAGGALFAMIGGWPTIIAAAAAGLGLLVARIMSASDEAVAAAQTARREMEETNKRFMEVNQQYRQNNPYRIAEDIRETEAALARMTGRFSEQSTVVQSTRARLAELVKEYERAGLNVAGLTDTATGARKGIDALNASLKEQAERLRQQQVQSKGGAAALAEYLTAQLKMGFATKEQRAENERLIAQIRELETQNKAVKESTDGATKAITSNGEAAREAADAAREFGRAQTEAQRGAESLQQMIDRLNYDSMAPHEQAAADYARRMQEIAESYAAIVSIGPPTAEEIARVGRAQALAAQKLVDDVAQIDKQIADKASESSRQWAEYWRGATDAVAGAFGDFVASGLKSFSDFGRSLKRIAQQIISDLVAQFLRSKIIIPIMAAAGLPTAALAGAGGAAAAGAAGAAAGGAGSGFLGGLLGGVGASIGGFTAGLGVAGSAGIVAAGQFGVASLAAGNLAVGLGSLAGALGPVALALVAINAIAGGRLFGTSYKTNAAGAQFDFGEGGATGFNFQEQSRRRALFQGTRRRTVTEALGEDAQGQIDAVFRAVGDAMAAAAGQLGIDVPARITASFRATTDSKGNLISEVGTILGRQYNESFEVFSRRIAAENVIGVLDAALDGEAGRIAEAWRGSADTLADGAQFLLTAATDLRGGFDLLGDASLTGVAELVQRLAGDGESLTSAYQRIAGATRLLDEAVALSGVTLDMTREQFVTFAAGIAEAAGGLEQAQALWAGYFQSFYTEQERGLAQLGQARTRASTLATPIGLNLSDFTGEGGAQAFRELFESQLPALSAEATVQWLQFADALGIVLDLQGRYTDAVMQTAESIGDFMSGISTALAEFAPAATLQQQLDAQRAANDEMLARAIELGASEEQLAQVRQLADRRIGAIIDSVADQTATLTSALRRLGIAATGTTEEIAVAASGLSQDFGTLFAEFESTFFTPAEQAAFRSGLAQQQLSQALQAAGLSTEELISRQELRTRIEAALTAGNYTLAESLLRVAAAMNQVEASSTAVAQSANAATAANYQWGNSVSNMWGGGGGAIIGAGNGPGGIDPGHSGLGPGGGIGDAAAQLAAELERLRQDLRDWLQSLTTGDLSPGRPRELLARAQADYQRLLALAQGGDAQALQQLQGASELVLRLGRQVFGSTADYNALYDQIISQVGGLVGFSAATGDKPGGGGSSDGVGRLNASAMTAAMALDQLSAALGLQPGSLSGGASAPLPSPVFGGQSDGVVSELRAQREADAAAARETQEILRSVRAELAELKAAQKDGVEVARKQTEVMRERR